MSVDSRETDLEWNLLFSNVIVSHDYHFERNQSLRLEFQGQI
jgi:hypothetical protein